MSLRLEELQEKYLMEYTNQPSGATKYLWRYHKDLDKWLEFLKNFSCKDKILDFGCGPCFALVAGNKLGLDITGLDIPGEPVYDDLHIHLNVTPVVYSGQGLLPFKDSVFNVIICSWAVLFNFSNPKYTRTPPDRQFTSEDVELSGGELEQRVLELRRISTRNARWFIIPPRHLETVASYNPSVTLLPLPFTK